MSYKEDINYKDIDNYDDDTNSSTKIGCAPFIIGAIIIIFLCIAARSCSRDISNPFGNNGYERSFID